MTSSAWTPARSGTALCLLVAATTLLVWPFGSYPFEDDWAYARSLLTWQQTGELRILDWNPMLLVGHLSWGLLFTLPFGFSFTAAKLSTVALFLLEGFALAALLRLAGRPERAVFALTVAVLLEPVHLSRAFHYATDVPTLAWSSLALLLYVRGLGTTATDRDLWLGSLAASFAWLIRPTGALVVVAAGLYLVLFDRSRLRRARTWLAAFSLPLATFLLSSHWYLHRHGPTEAFTQSRRTIGAFWAQADPASVAWALTIVLAYLGFFLLPIGFSTKFGLTVPSSKPARAGLIAGVLGLAVLFSIPTASGRSFPYLWNLLTRFGLFSPNELLLGDRAVLWPAWGGWLLTAAVFVSLLAVLPAMAPPRRRDERGGQRLCLWRLAAILLLLQLVYSVVTIRIAFDRHLLPVLPPAVALVAASTLRLRPRLCLILTVCGGLVTATLLHDVHAFSRAAARAADEMIAEGIDPLTIDAGYAATSWHAYERSRRETGVGGRTPRARRYDSWWVRSLTPRVLTRHVLSLSTALHPQRWADATSPEMRALSTAPDLSHYQPVRALHYRRFWPPGRGTVWILRDTRTSEVEADG